MTVLKSFVSIWLAVLILGIGLQYSINYFRDGSNDDAGSSSAATDAEHAAWKHFEWHGDVELLRRPIPGSKLLAHRAVATVDMPIEVIWDVFRDTPNNRDWAKDMSEAKEYPESVKNRKKGKKRRIQTSIVTQRYKVPIPGISDREFLMNKKTIAVENRAGTLSSVTVNFESIDNNENIPVCRGCVRGVNLGSRWTFTSIEGGERGHYTKIEADVAVDPLTPNLSTFFINNFQKFWPHVSVRGLIKVARQNLKSNGDVPVRRVSPQGLMSKMFPRNRRRLLGAS